jgi:TolA-binding protein
MLTPRKRISKKELKEDKLITYSVQAREWIEDNQKNVLIAVAVVVIALAAFFIISNAREKKALASSAELAKAVQLYDARDFVSAISLLTDVTNSYKNTESGKLARFYLAQSLYNTGEYAAAQEHFRKFASGFKADEYLKVSALLGEAACLEQQDQFADAAGKFESLGKKYPESPKAAQAYLRAARCYDQAGNSDKAAGLYQLIVDEYPNSPEKNDAMLYSAM